MGVWVGTLGRLTVQPEPDEQLFREFAYFCSNTCPEGYREDEVFANPWFFDQKNRLISGIGKFAEPIVWYEHLKTFFFRPRGYELLGDPEYVWEGELDLWKLGEEREEERRIWRHRLREVFQESEGS